MFACRYVIRTRSEENSGAPGTGVRNGWEPPCRCWELNLRLWQAIKTLNCRAISSAPRYHFLNSLLRFSSRWMSNYKSKITLDATAQRVNGSTGLVLGFGPSVGPLDRNISWLSDDVTCGLWDRISSLPTFQTKGQSTMSMFRLQDLVNFSSMESREGRLGRRLGWYIACLANMRTRIGSQKLHKKTQVLCTL